MNFGMSGTQAGVTNKALATARRLLKPHVVEQFHHGDCIGADEQVHDLIQELYPDLVIDIHPPIMRHKRAFKRGRMHAAKEYLDRNTDIVEQSKIMLIFPYEKEEQLRSGTWSTYRRAVKRGREIWLIHSDGTHVVIPARRSLF